MAITHSTVKASGDTGTHEDWNANHVVDDNSKPKNDTTLIVAASNSLDTTRADYVCNAVDDQDTINEAMAALAAHGGRISLLDGTYQLSNPITYPDDDISIVGLGSNTVIQTPDNVEMINANGKSNIVIEDVHIVGAGAGNALNYGIRFINCADAVIRGCWIETCGNSGINVFGSDRIIVEGSFSQNNRVVGLNVIASVDGNIINNILNGNQGAGMSLSVGCNNTNIIGNHADDSVTHGGIIIQGSGHCTITANQANDNAGVGVDLDAASDRNTVVSNIVTGNGVAQVRDLGANNDVAHNQVI